MCITGVSPVQAGPRWPCDWAPKRERTRLAPPWARCPCYDADRQPGYEPDALRHRAGSSLAPRARRDWGDGKVDIEDLKVFMTYYEKANPPKSQDAQ
jgi:hypothetical protein